jgi:hypothetical protein
MGLEKGVELIQHHPRLDGNPQLLSVKFQDRVQPFAVVDDERGADGLPALRGARATRKNGNFGVGRDGDCRQGIRFGFRHHDADRFDLVNRGIGAIAAARRSVEQHVT